MREQTTKVVTDRKRVSLICCLKVDTKIDNVYCNFLVAFKRFMVYKHMEYIKYENCIFALAHFLRLLKKNRTIMPIRHF